MGFISGYMNNPNSIRHADGQLKTGGELREVWANNVAPHLVGRKIIGVEWQSDEEKESFGFRNSAVKILVENGKDGDPIVLTAMRDDEGNDAGAIATNIVGIETLPVI
jgi:hypothetical protein